MIRRHEAHTGRFATAGGIVAILVLMSCGSPGTPPPGSNELTDDYWIAERTDPILEKTATIRLAPDLSGLSEGEQIAVDKLLAIGAIFQKIYEDSVHHQALQAYDRLVELHDAGNDSERTEKLLRLYRLFRGPIVRDLQNEREPFLPVDPVVPGKNVYPLGITKQEVDYYLQAYPEQRAAVLDLRGIVRWAEPAPLQRDLEVLDRHPLLDALHPGLKDHLERLRQEENPNLLYTVPYSIAWYEEILQAYDLLNEAADAVEQDDDAFARYLRLRGRDLVADNYDGGDAAWVTSRFKNLNAQIGSYETYDDELYGVKSFFSLSLLLRDRERSDALQQAIGGLQVIEDSLPYDAHKKVREDIPVGVYRVIADFGQSRGTNTATILPNESHLSRLYGRTILLRSNIMTNPDLFGMSQESFNAAVHPDHHADLKINGNFERTLWHEVGHYLGVDRTRDGRDLGDALESTGDVLEEMKSDLVSLFSVPILRQRGYFDDETVRAVYASGIRRVLQNNRPQRSQPYQTMQLLQWNYFLEQGLLSFDKETRSLRIRYELYPTTVRSLLEQVLAIQYEGEKERAEQFITRYSTWEDDVHGVIAQNIKDAESYRYRLVRYAALGE